MEGDPTDIGIIGGFENESEDSRLEKKSDDKMPEERSEGLGEKVLDVTGSLAEKTKNEKALVASQKILRIVELAMKLEDGLSLSDEEVEALLAEYTRESQLAKDEGYSYELFDILSEHQSFYDSNLYGDMLGKGFISVPDVVRKFGKEALKEDTVLKGSLRKQIEGILDNSSDITEQQIELLRVLKENGINIVELMARNGDGRSRMDAQSEELNKNNNYLFDVLVENGLLDVKDILSSQQVLFEEYNRSSNGSIIIANFLDRVIADYPDEISEEEGYWLEVAKEHGAGKLLEFAHKINEGDTSVFGEYDSNEAEVQTALFGVLKNNYYSSMGKPMAFLISKEMNAMLDDPEAVQKMLDVSEGSGRTGSSLDVLIVGNAERLDRWVKEGVFDGRPKREDSRLLKNIQDGSLTEKERLRLVFRNFILDESVFDKDSNSIEELYYSISDVYLDRNKQYADLKLAFFRKDFQKKVIEECYAANGTISPFLYVSDEALEHAEGVSDSVRAFLRLFGGSVSDIGFKLTDIRIEDIEKYFDADGPTESFYTECLADNYGFFLQKIDANELSRIGLEPKTYYRILNNLYAEQIINVHDFASVNREAAHAVLGDSKEVDDYLDLMSLFSDTGDYSSARRDCARAVSLDDISRYYVNGALTKDFMEGPFMQMSFSTIGELGEKAFEDMGVSADEYRKAIKEKFYLSEPVVAREILYALDKKAIKEAFSDDRRLLMYLELIDYNRSDSFGVAENISVSELPKYFTEEGEPTAELASLLICSGVPSSIRDLRRLNITLSDSTEMLLNGILYEQIITGENDELDEANVLAALARFLRMDAYDWEGATENDLKVKKAFSEENIQNKNLAMKMLRREYAEFLKTGIMPIGLKCFADYMRKCDGAGPLTQIEAFLDYCGELDCVDEKTIDGIRGVEARIRKWDDRDKANYYAISAEILKADPEIFGEFIEVFGRIKEEEDFVVFAKEIYPLFRAKLALLKEYDNHSNSIGDGNSTANYKNVDKEKIKNDLHIALLPFSFEGKGEGEDDRAYLERRHKGIEMVKRNIFGEITGLFQEKFDILPEAIPGELDDEAVRSIEDMVLYLSNMHNPDSRKKNIIGFFLALQLMKNEKGGTKWDDFRAGLSVSPTSCLGGEAARSVESALSVSESKNPIKSQDIGIVDEGRLKDFRIALQDETSEIRVGNTSTVDARLQNISQNIRELMDPDLYDDPIDKAKIDLLRRYGSKKINSVAAKMWQRQNGKNIDFTAEEEEIASGLGQMLTENGIELSSKSINEHLQRGFKDLGKIFAAYEVIETSNIDEMIFELQDLLMPRGEILTILQEMGEEFKSHSGVLALSADIAFLENLVAKAEKKGSLSGDIEEQRRKIALVRGYLNEVHAKFGEISRLYEELVKKFDNIKIQPIAEGDSGRDKLIAKMQEIRSIIGSRASGAQTTIVTRCSNKMTTIVENMRACLSCKTTNGVNNDTDLTFGESYKFYLYSSGSAGETGSMSDEIVYFVPVEDKNGERRMSFVMDRLYGSKNRDIYYNHAATLVKKAKELKKRFPEARISVLLTASSAMSCAARLDARELASHIGAPQTATVVEHESLGVEIPESGFGDHYIEINEGSARRAGRREVGGIEIIF